MISNSKDNYAPWDFTIKNFENEVEEQKTFQFDWEVLLDSNLFLSSGAKINAFFSRVYVEDKDLVKLGTEKEIIEQVVEKLSKINVNLNHQKFIHNIEKLGFVPGFEVLPMEIKSRRLSGESANKPIVDENYFSQITYTPYQSSFSKHHHANCNFKTSSKKILKPKKQLNYAAQGSSNESLSDEINTSSETHSTSSTLDSTKNCLLENKAVDLFFDFGFCVERDAKLVAKNTNKFMHADKEVMKYWFQRYRLFSKLNDGILMDREGWFSVTPERIAVHIAERLVRTRGMVILDAFTGVGGNAIQFARCGANVIALDWDPVKIRCAAHNARIYGVADRIHFICTNFFHFAKFFKSNVRKLLPVFSNNFDENTNGFDAVFLSPPWGGPAYLQEKEFDLKLHLELDGFEIFRVVNEISPNICYFLPRNTSVKQLISLAETTGKVEIEQNLLNGKVKTICAYYGNLVAT